MSISPRQGCGEGRLQAGVLPVTKAGGLVAGNPAVWGTAEGSYPIFSPVSVHLPLASRENRVAAGHHNVQQQAGKSPAKACHTGGPATAGPLREELMALLEGFLVFPRRSSRWKSQQQLDSVRGRLLWHGARRWDQEGDSVTRECLSFPGPFQHTAMSWLPPPFQLPGAWISHPAK